MKKVLCGLLSLVVMLTSIQLNVLPAEAATTEMTIYDLFLGVNTGASSTEAEEDAGKGGDSVMLESQGEYLLMDMGYYEQAQKYVIPFIKKHKIKELSIYFSHMHIDHYAGKSTDITAGLDAVAAIPGIKIKNLYLPDASIGRTNPEYSAKYDRFVEAYNSYSNTTGKVIRLKKGKTFTIGSAFAEVIGPVNVTKKMSQNDLSLVTMITCGKTRYLTAGDCMSTQEELLLKEYKGTSKLKADIMKLSHHGTPQANTEEFIKKVRPQYAFAQNSGYTGKLTDTQYKWRIMHRAWSSVNEYGMAYLTANEKKDLVINVNNNKITLYRGTETSSNKLSGWVSLQGGTGLKNDTTVKYYIQNGKLAKGVKKIGGKKYYFDTCMMRGRYSAKTKKWDSLVGFGKSYRYFNTTTGVMTTGFQTLKGSKYYYDENGLRLMGTGSCTIKKIKGNYYGLSKAGVFARNCWRKFSNKRYRYFDKTGKMLIGWQTMGGKKYYFDKDGFRTDNKIVKIGKYKYYFTGSGKMVAGQMYNVGKYRYYFDKKGRMAVKKYVTYQGRKYYFDKNGRMVQGK
ncbi:MAG: hypothetical protein HFH37_02350 [Lachnospiraceae bacterium]|jgi:Predicted hydrolase (metallo-beta-lactamase superfamily)|nr:hypothetical protein [Lachnospiraceae bacterium]